VPPKILGAKFMLELPFMFYQFHVHGHAFIPILIPISMSTSVVSVDYFSKNNILLSITFLKIKINRYIRKKS
jgi:hypothetical protein